MIDYEMIAAREAIAQTLAAALDVQASYMAIYLTMLFAYISLAYLVGKELSRFQSTIVTIIFIAGAGRQVALITAAGMATRLKAAQLREIYEDSPAQEIVAGTGISIWWPIVLWSAGIILALFFMWSVRHPKTE